MNIFGVQDLFPLLVDLCLQELLLNGGFIPFDCSVFGFQSPEFGPSIGELPFGVLSFPLCQAILRLEALSLGDQLLGPVLMQVESLIFVG